MDFNSQYSELLFIVLKLKRWKLAFIIIVLAAAASHVYLYKPIQLMSGQAGDLDVVGQKEFMSSNLVVGDWEKDGKDFLGIIDDASIRMSGNRGSKGIPMVSCDDEEECQKKYFELLLGKEPGKTFHYIRFNSSKDRNPKLQCQVTSGSELYCPFIYYLISISLPLDNLSLFQYKTVHTFKLKSLLSVLITPRDGNSTICTQDVSFPIVIHFVLMAAAIFLTASFGFYLVIGTLSCIYELKQSGFLKLMFQRRLSAWAYWIAIWTVSLVEILMITIVHTAAHHYQCPGFYPRLRLVLVFFGTFVQLCCATAFILLITVLIRDVVIASFLASLFHLIYVGCIVAHKFALKTPHKYIWLKHLIFAVPFGHFAEQINVMLRNGDGYENAYFDSVLPASAALLVVLVTSTIYLDSALKTGNGRRYPLYYVFTRRFWSLNEDELVTIIHPTPSVMVEDFHCNMELKLCTRALKKRYSAKCVGLDKFSATFYQDQITSIVGHNGSGKSTLLQILSGDRLPTKGEATISNLLITDPVYRNHLSNDIGYCPQADALVDRLTVLDTLSLIAVSSGLSWDDIQEDVVSVLTVLQIETKLNDHISSLSNGEKRMLCVTMALVGKPKVVLLDCPARDLDYVSKRRLWKLLLEYKKGRVVIMSTLFIDEAEGMADRIIFLSGGRVICAGSPFFLRRAFDCRFIIQIASKTEFHVLFMARRLIAKFQSIRVRSYGNKDLELEVPVLEYDILPALMQDIEGMTQLFDEFGIKHHSLDEIYTKLQYLKPSEVEEHFQSSTIGYIADDVDRMRAEKSLQLSDTLPDGPEFKKLTPCKMTTLIGMVIVHFLLIKRSFVRLLVRVVLPVSLLLLLIGGALIEKNMENEKRIVKYDLRKVDELDQENGACFSYVMIPKIKNASFDVRGIPDSDCSMYLFATPLAAENIKKLEIPAQTIEDTQNFERIITEPMNFFRVAKLCIKSKSPCPVIYSSDWGVENHVVFNHDVYVGVYIPPMRDDPMKTVTSLIHSFRNTLRQTTRAYLKVPKVNVTDKSKLLYKLDGLNVEGILAMRSIFYPFYGMFAQIVLLAAIPSLCLIDIIQDRKSGVFNQLLTMSMSRLHYWLCTLLNHWIQLAILYFVSTLVLMLLVSPGYMNKFFAGAVFAPTLTFGLTNGLLCVYIIGSLTSESGYILVAGHLFFSLIVSLSALIVQSSDLVGQYMIYLLPHFAIIAPTFYGTRFAHYSLSLFRRTKIKKEINLLDYIFKVQHIRDALIAQMVHFGILIALFIIMENRKAVCKCCYKKEKVKAKTYSHELCKDKLVAAEARHVEGNAKREEDIMEVDQLQAINSKGKTVLKNLTFGLRNGETLGLLGPCFSGKSSAIRIFVGDQRPCFGRVDFHIDDKWVTNDIARGQAFIGYCPKNDPLIEMLTVSENLLYYTRLIGASTDRLQGVLQQFFLEKEANELVVHATTGVKRRLTLAISVLHNPRFVAINQVSAGVDPHGREVIWHSIKSLTSKRRGILVATQQVEEAENLCERICIMTSGLMSSLSNVDELFDKCKKSYFLEIQIGDSSNLTPDGIELAKAKIIGIVLGKFKQAVIIEQLTLRLQFGIPFECIGVLSKALAWLVDKTKTLKLLYFSLHLATVDQAMRIVEADIENQAANGASNQMALASA